MTGDPVLLELAERVGRRLAASGCRLVTAESCTGGWIAKTLTDVAGSSQWFECGFVTYSNRAKRRDLGVAEETLDRHGAVSEATVREMAQGALMRSGAQVAVAVSGIAGPDGGLPGKPVGTVWFATARRHDSVVDTEAQARRFEGDRETVRRRAVEHALALVAALPVEPGVRGGA